VTLAHFERATAPESYARALAHAYFAGYRIYDPSLSASRDPEAERKMMRFPAIAAPLQVRHTSISGRRWSISPPDEGAEAEKAVSKIVGKALGHLDGFTPARLLLARADVSGTRYAEVQKHTVTESWGDGVERQWVVPYKLKDIPKENFRWAPNSGSPRPTATLEYARKRSGTIRWVPVPTWAPLVRHVILDSEEMLGYGTGLRDALHYIYGIMTRTFEADSQAAERFGHGWVVLALDHESAGSPLITNSAMVTNSHNALEKMRARHNFIIGKNDKLEFLGPPAGSAEWMGKLFERLARMADRMIMGATLFAGGGDASEGSMARAETEADTASGVFDTLSDMLEETLTRDLVAPVFRDNHANFNELGLGDADHPSFEIVRGRKDDPKEVAERAEIVLRSGAKIKADEYYDGVGFTKPGPKDEVIEGPPEPAGAGLPGMPFSASDEKDAPLRFTQTYDAKGLRALVRRTTDE